MLVRKLKVVSHPGIGPVDLDFTDEDGNTYEIVIIAGENGTGKSSILNILYSAFNFETQDGSISAEVEIELSDREQSLLRNYYHRHNLPKIVILSYTPGPGKGYNQIYILKWNEEDVPHEMEMNTLEPNSKLLFRVFFNEAEVDYNVSSSGSITGLTFDSTSNRSSRSKGTAQSIAQLIVDIRNSDSEQLSTWVEANPGSPPPPDVVAGRMERFRSAFQIMMPNKRFHRVVREAGRVFAEFIEYSRAMPLEKLSTGEKQIIFRGGYLLRDRDNLSDAMILVDEPELSLHPDWQERVINFYREITRQPDNTHPQLFVATHSPFIVHGAAGAKVVILERDAVSGVISEAVSPSYPIASGQAAIRAFRLENFVASAAHRTLVMTEGHTDAMLITAAWSKLRSQSPPFEIRSALGAKNISSTLNDSELGSKLGPRRILGIYDFDYEGYNQWNGAWRRLSSITGIDTSGIVKHHATLRARCMLLPVPSIRSSIAGISLANRSMMPIELLFDDSDLPVGMLDHIAVAGGAQIPVIRDTAKRNFATHAQSLPATSFVHFEPLLVEIERFVSAPL